MLPVLGGLRQVLPPPQERLTPKEEDRDEKDKDFMASLELAGKGAKLPRHCQWAEDMNTFLTRLKQLNKTMNFQGKS